MPRIARIVLSGIPHHITQRGNCRQDVFFSDADRVTYLDWLGHYCRESRVEVLAYCLMTNHVHLILVPATDDGLEAALRPLHMRYAQRVNRNHGRSGHLWQGRYFSAPMDELYCWTAIRYVERNPVRAQFVAAAEDYAWSSAAAHCGSRQDAVLTQRPEWREQFDAVAGWSGWLAEVDRSEDLDTLRQNTERGLPCGSAAFVRELERTVGRPLVPQARGRPKKLEGPDDGASVPTFGNWVASPFS